MRKVFSHGIKGREAVGQLLSLRQGNRSVKYSVTFCILAVKIGWDQAAMEGILLCEEVKDELALRDNTTSLDALIDYYCSMC